MHNKMNVGSQLKIKELKNKKDSIQFDFFIGNKQLSELLNIDRFDMMYSDFDLDIFNVDKTRFPDYNRKEINVRAVSFFLGNTNPINQFGTNRIVLYRCHCGSDYCGVVSFQLQREGNFIVWKDIGYESDNGFESEMNDRRINPIKELRFDQTEYQSEFEQYLEINCA